MTENEIDELLEQARVHSSAGYPLERGTRFWHSKKAVYRVSRLFLDRQIAFNVAVVEALNRLSRTLEGLCADSSDARDRLTAVEAGLEREQQRGNLVHRQMFADRHDDVAALRAELIDLRLLLKEELDALRDEHARDGVRGHAERARVDALLAELRRVLPDEVGSAPTANGELAGLPAAWEEVQGAFDEAFRGPYDTIKERARAYVDDVLRVGTRLPVLDIGCGRGEWLELLAEADVRAYGIDLSARAVALSSARGLDARREDLIGHLRGLPAESLAAVTAFHVAEHLPLAQLLELLDLGARAIAPGGLLILETPNPDNVIVGASTFWLDPTHVQPLPPALLEFLVQARGFADTEVRYFERDPAPIAAPAGNGSAPGDALVQRLATVVDQRFGSAADYAVIGRRP